MPPRPPSPLILLGTAVLTVLEGATAAGAPLPTAIARTLRKPDDRDESDKDPSALLLVPPHRDQDALFAAHRSHSSHSSHSSHYSGSGGGGSHRSGGYDTGYAAPAPEPPPPPPPPPRRLRPANVSFVAFPGGTIFVDDREVGRDTTRPVRLTVGRHRVRIENRFLGTGTRYVDVTEGQTGVIMIEW